MRKLKIVHIGAGSGFVLSIARELLSSPIFDDAEFVLSDLSEERLKAAITELLAETAG